MVPSEGRQLTSTDDVQRESRILIQPYDPLRFTYEVTPHLRTLIISLLKMGKPPKIQKRELQLRSLSLETRERPWIPTKIRMRKEPTSRLLIEYIFILTPFSPFFFQVPVDVGRCSRAALSQRGVVPKRQSLVGLLESFLRFHIWSLLYFILYLQFLFVTFDFDFIFNFGVLDFLFSF